jgi:3-carboxy-cis,cis-muconate cycloisomerase
MTEAVSGQAWVRAMLAFESALARVEAEFSLIPAEAAREIATACEADVDPGELATGFSASATPVIPLLDVLRARLGGRAREALHFGATSQDVVDTAMMLVTRRGFEVLLASLGRVEAECARLAALHRETVMAGRTLFQQAAPITFGLKAALWLSALMEAEAGVRRVRDERLALQLAGPVGTLAGFDGRGLELAASLARELGLLEPLAPWHTSRARIAEMGSALGIVAGTVAKIAGDLLLLAQTEVGEVREGTGGGSSAMPNKQNSAGCVAVAAAARRALVLAPGLLQSMVQEHERAAGGWQAEWETVTDLFLLTDAAISRLAGVLAGLDIDGARMRANIDAGGGLVMGQNAALVLGERMGAEQARQVVDGAISRVRANGTSLRAELAREDQALTALGEAGLDAACDPSAGIGSATILIDRVLAAYGERAT